MHGYSMSVPMSHANRDRLYDRMPHYTSFLNLQSIHVAATVGIYVLRIQCLYRGRTAWLEVNERRIRRNAARTIQRNYRIRYRMKCWLDGDAVRLALLRRAHALEFKRLEVEKAIIVQCCYRQLKSRRLMDLRRLVDPIEILKMSSSKDVIFGPHRMFETDRRTFWCSAPQRVSHEWMEFKTGAKVCIGQVRMLAAPNTSSPKNVVLERWRPTGRRGGVWRHVHRFEIWLMRGWQMIHVPREAAKWPARKWRLRFEDNHGSSEGIAVHGLQFYVPKEDNPVVGNVPHDIERKVPQLGEDPIDVELEVKASAWPMPEYQWYQNGKPVEGANDARLVLNVDPMQPANKAFKCIHCKKRCRRCRTTPTRCSAVTAAPRLWWKAVGTAARREGRF